MQKIVLGIDVGVKSLSLCIKGQDILLWNVFDLVGDVRKCSGVTLTGKACTKTANMQYLEEFYCKTHSKGLDATPYNTLKINTMSMQQLSVIVTQGFSTIMTAPEFIGVTHVSIEYQPKINNKMKFASHVIFSMLCDFYKKEKNTVIRFTTANKKTRLTRQKREKKGKMTKGDCYKRRKQDSVVFVNSVLSGEWKEFFNSHKKKDDLADALCYCIIESREHSCR
jgi:hypothetical protein